MNTLCVDTDFVPCPVEDGDELFANGTFVFNVTRILERIERDPAEVALLRIAVSSFPRWVRPLDDAHVASADLARPLLLAEIAPGSYNLIDGHHRVANARRRGIDALQAYALTAVQHMPFLTSTSAYATYVAYWNGKLREHGEEVGTGALGRGRPGRRGA